MAEARDIAGELIEVGDLIAVAFRTSTNAYIRTGVVVGMGTKGKESPVDTVRVRWQLAGGWRNLPAESDIEVRTCKQRAYRVGREEL